MRHIENALFIQQWIEFYKIGQLLWSKIDTTHLPRTLLNLDFQFKWKLFCISGFKTFFLHQTRDFERLEHHQQFREGYNRSTKTWVFESLRCCWGQIQGWIQLKPRNNQKSLNFNYRWLEKPFSYFQDVFFTSATATHSVPSTKSSIFSPNDAPKVPPKVPPKPPVRQKMRTVNLTDTINSPPGHLFGMEIFPNKNGAILVRSVASGEMWKDNRFGDI